MSNPTNNGTGMRRVERRALEARRPLARARRSASRAVLLLTLGVLAVMIVLPLPSSNSAGKTSPWLGDRPVASFLFTDEDALSGIASDLGLTGAQTDALREIGRNEMAALSLLKQQSEPVVERTDISLEQKQGAIMEMDYNTRVAGIVTSSRTSTEGKLTAGQKAMLADVIARRMQEQKQTFADAAATAALGPMTTGASGSYRVYATQYYSNFGSGSVDVAVPDKYVKFSSLGWEYHSGYPSDLNYSVNLGYNGNSLNGVRVLDCGPWNIDDNYWNAASGPRPRRIFADLPAGLPESQAAYFDDYNGGLDQFGRAVSNPAGIDLSPQAGVRLGLGYLVSGWVTVTFNWENMPAPPPPPATIPVIGAIRVKYDRLGGAPGTPLSQEYDVPGGRAQDFARGRIMWQRSTGHTHWLLGAIMTRFDQMGGVAGIGFPLTDEAETPSSPGGRMMLYERGIIYWSQNTGPHAVQGGIYVKFMSLGAAGQLGLPVSDEYGAGSGRASDFERGRIYWSPREGTHAINGAIMVKYLASGGPGSLGLPTSDEYAVPGGRASDFASGRIYWSAGTGAQRMNGAILVKYLSMGGPGELGLPTSDEYDVAGGRASNLQTGRIYWSPRTGPHHVTGAIMARYDRQGGPAAAGFPLTDEIAAPGSSNGRMNEFERAQIFWSPTLGSAAVYGGILVKYRAVGGPMSYGLPLADEEPVEGKPGARMERFERGRIYWSPATGTSQVYGAILGRYLLDGGPLGRLGLPVSDEYSVPGGRRSDFQGGYIIWNYFSGGTQTVLSGR